MEKSITHTRIHDLLHALSSKRVLDLTCQMTCIFAPPDRYLHRKVVLTDFHTVLRSLERERTAHPSRVTTFGVRRK